MKIAYISFSKIPSREANSIHVMKMCQAFQQEGHETTLYVPRTGKEHVDLTALWHHYGITAPFPLRYISVRRYPFTALKDHMYALKTVFRIRRERTELVYTRHLYSAMWASLLGIPTVLEEHSPVQGGKLGKVYVWAMVKGKDFQKLVVITHALKQIYPKRFIKDDQIIVAPDGIDLERFENLPVTGITRMYLDIPYTSFVAGYSGHLYPGRGLELILNLAERLSGVIFLIIGGMENDIMNLRTRIKELGLKNIRLAGFLPNSEMPGYLSACDVLLMPYQRKVTTVNRNDDTSTWMSPMKMFEYMAAGRLIISSDLPVIREVLNETNAALCIPDDMDAWQHAIEQAVTDKEWREKHGKQARQDVEQYTWRRRIQRILSELDIRNK